MIILSLSSLSLSFAVQKPVAQLLGWLKVKVERSDDDDADDNGSGCWPVTI
jgi:hypothetical protein